MAALWMALLISETARIITVLVQVMILLVSQWICVARVMGGGGGVGGAISLLNRINLQKATSTNRSTLQYNCILHRCREHGNVHATLCTTSLCVCLVVA